MSYPDAIVNAQRVLRALAGYTGAIDGDPGPRTLAAASAVVVPTGAAWPPARLAVAAAQRLLSAEGFDTGPVDGLYGPQTDAAYEIWRQAGRGEPYLRPDEQHPVAHVAGRWGTEAELRARFGAPAGPRCTAARVAVPWRAVLAWDLRAAVEEITCHEDVAASLARVFECVADTHTEGEIHALGLHLFGGCYNPRRKRGGSAWSTHAWGVALDWDPARNRLRQDHTEARLARPDAARWWHAWEAEGWTGLGRVADFDWMHVQAPAR